jgi:hypothetical protein
MKTKSGLSFELISTDDRNIARFDNLLSKS